jgi:hypothetical protein
MGAEFEHATFLCAVLRREFIISNFANNSSFFAALTICFGRLAGSSTRVSPAFQSNRVQHRNARASKKTSGFSSY